MNRVKITEAGAEAQRATPAQHAAPARPSSDDAERIEAGLAYRLAPLLRAIELLADSQRVLADLSELTKRDHDLGQRLSFGIYAWLSPLREGEASGLAVLADLARIAGDINGEIVNEAEALRDRLPLVAEGSRPAEQAAT